MPTTPLEFAYDVFISYSHRDQTWVRDELLPGLEKAGLKVCIDYRTFRVGAPIVKEMERAVLTSRHTLLVLTPAYLDSAWTDFEALMIATLDPGSQKARLLPLLLQRCDLPIRIKYLGYADFTAPDDLTLSWQRLLKALSVSDGSSRQVQTPRLPQYEIPDEALERYYEQIVRQYGWIRIFGQTTPKPLREVFTDVYMLDKPTAQRRFDPDALREHLWEQDRGMSFRYEERLPAQQLLNRKNKFFILGKPGAGKTTFLKHLAVREAQRGKWGHCIGKIPIFVPLKQFVESGTTLFDFIVNQFAVCHFPNATPFVEPLLKAGRALVLFDGLDEVAKNVGPRTDRRGLVTKLIEQFSRQYDGCHIVITCRIAATEYMFDPDFTYLELADFAPDQVEAFVRNWFSDPAAPDRSAGLARRMLDELVRQEHRGIRDLARNPLLLTLLCLNYAETLSFPARRVEVYEEALDALLKKWDASRQIQRSSLYRNLSLGRKKQMFSRIAYDGFVQNEILFGQADLEARLKVYLAHVPEVPDAIDMDAEAVLAEIIEQHGIFAEQSRGLFSFAHLTFQEYYVAKHLSESPTPDALDSLMARMIDNKWREVFLLTASQLSDATSFLATFEVALHRLVAPRPRLVAWLRWIDEQAATSQVMYRRPATRFYYARVHARAYALAHALTLGPALDLDRTLDLDEALTNALGLDQALTDALNLDRDLASALTLAGDLANALDRDRKTMLKKISVLCLELDDTNLNTELSTLVVPSAEASRIIWSQFASQLGRIVKASRTRMLSRYRQLEAEAEALMKKGRGRFDLDLEDLELFFTCLKATRLFYDCLQLAYTPDRRAFEDRILLPPPLTNQEA